MTSQDFGIVAVGAGPSSLAFGIAMEELAPDHLARRTVLFEQHSDIRWQRGLLLPWAVSQVSCLKDLVMLRNPRSRFTFLNFLRESGRLDEFINLGTFTPYRSEISNYLQWVAGSLQKVDIQCNRRCQSIEPQRGTDGSIRRWLVRLEDGTTVAARDLVVGAGRDPHIPEVFADLPSGRIIHSTQYVEGIAQLPKGTPYRVVVIGGAQSAAEMFRAVHDDLPGCQPTIVMRSIGFGNYQTSKFINELFYPSFINKFFVAEDKYRQRVLEEMRETNYAGLAPGLLDELYRMLYLQRLAGKEQSRVVTMTEIVGARIDGNEIVLETHNRACAANDIEDLRCDIVLLGTGFDGRQPQLIRSLARSLGCDSLAVNRSYRATLTDSGEAGLYLQGVNEDTHGIADSLLSVLAQRAGDIVGDILHRRGHQIDGRSKELVSTVSIG